MKNSFLLTAISFFITSCCVYTKGEDGKPGKDGISAHSKMGFNQKLADSLGADQYGMKGYAIVMLTTGTAKIDDKAKKAELMKGRSCRRNFQLRNFFVVRFRSITSVSETS